MPRKIIFLFDLFFVLFAFLLTTFIYTELKSIPYNWSISFASAAVCVAVTGLFFFVFKTYSALLRYSTFKDALRIWISLFCSNIILAIIAYFTIHQLFLVTLAIFFINFLLTFVFVFFFRMLVRLLFDYVNRFYEGKSKHIKDLLGRTPIEIDTETIRRNQKGKRVLVTGAAGSIGSEIVRQLCQFDLDLLILCDIAETPLHQLGLNLKEAFPDVKFVSIIADVRNKIKMEYVFSTYKPHYVYHAAAYKHVPMMEDHPGEAILTNVLGTQNVADMAMAYGTEHFVMISTDKAVNPSNVMGASKRIAEIYIQALSGQLKKKSANHLSPIRFITTRFGNVLGSNGSVIPIFEKQIKEGGPVTVTDPDIIRYFMTIPEACSLVLEAGNFGNGGEVFIFDMGEPVRIKDMAEEMIRLSGFKPYEDINIVFTGLRPGEKLYEELLYDKETNKPTHNKKIMVGNVCAQDLNELLPLLNRLIEVSYTCNKMEIVSIMKQIVPEFVSINSEFEVLDQQ